LMRRAVRPGRNSVAEQTKSVEWPQSHAERVPKGFRTDMENRSAGSSRFVRPSLVSLTVSEQLPPWNGIHLLLSIDERRCGHEIRCEDP